MSLCTLTSPRWRHLDRPDMDWSNHFSDVIRQLERENPDAVPDFHRVPRLYLFSDYGGDHTTYRTYSFLLVSEGAVQGWRRHWEPARDVLLPAGRHLEYKSLGDRHKREALGPFLKRIDGMNGLLMTFAVDQRVATMFRDDAESRDRANTLLTAWSPRNDERLWRIVHFATLIVSGLACSGQSVWWWSDRDRIAEDHDQEVAFWELWLSTLDSYGRNDLDDLRFASKDEESELAVRDLLAVPDITAGSLADVLTKMTPGAMPTPQLLSTVSRTTKPKALNVLGWYTKRGTRLRRLLCVCTAARTSGRFRSQWMVFSDYNAMRPSLLWLPGT